MQGHVRAIFDLRPLHKENHKELRELLDGVLKHLCALKALKRPTESWDDLIIHIITSKPASNLPTLKALTKFLQQRIQVLKVIANKNDNKLVSTNKPQSNKNKTMSAHASSSIKGCGVCDQIHFLYQCDDFRTKPVETRVQIADNLDLCRNCLSSTQHKSSQCPSTSCRKCHRKHNTLLHLSHAGNTYGH